jgi:threonyl-tRNA synthetase
MRLLILDCNKFEYKLDHKTPVGEDVRAEMIEKYFNDVLVVFAAAEDKDDPVIIEKAALDINKLAKLNKSSLIIINPFAHLSSRLAKPQKAIRILDELVDKLKEKKEINSIRGIFGWYKQFVIDVKGHDNSQVYREY